MPSIRESYTFFIGRIGAKGHGHGEYNTIDVDSVELNKDKKEIYIHDWHTKKIHVYNYDGKCKKCQPVYFHFNGMAYYNNRAYFCTVPYKTKDLPMLDRFHVTICKNEEGPVAGMIENRG